MINEPIIYAPTAPQTVAYGVAAGTSTAFGAQITAIRLHATTDCFVLFSVPGTSATSATGFFLGAARPEYFSVAGAQKVSVIQSIAAGNLYVSELTR